MVKPPDCREGGEDGSEVGVDFVWEEGGGGDCVGLDIESMSVARQNRGGVGEELSAVEDMQ